MQDAKNECIHFFLQSFYNVFDLFLVCTETMWMYLETKY